MVFFLSPIEILSEVPTSASMSQKLLFPISRLYLVSTYSIVVVIERKRHSLFSVVLIA